MSSSNSIEEFGSSWTSGNSSSDEGDIMNETLLAVSLALGIMAFMIALFSSSVMIALLYCIIRLRHDMEKLKRGGGAGHVAENGVPILSAKRDKFETSQKLKEYESEPSRAGPSTFSIYNTLSKRSETISTSMPESPLAAMNPPNENYATIASILPAELRTRKNLEGQPLTMQEAETLCREQKRREESYEEVEGREKREKAAIEAARARGRGWGVLVDQDTYYNPADAIEEDSPVPRSILIPKLASQETGSEDQKPFQLASPGTPGSYTAVFNELPPGQREVIGAGKKTERLASDSAPLGSTKPHGQRRPDPAGYEDIHVAEDMFGTTEQRALPANTDVMALSSSVGGFLGGQRGAVLEGTREKERGDPLKRHSMPSTARRDLAKEMVEINPSSRKPVTLSSQRKKKQVQHTAHGRKGAKGKDEDEEDGEGGGGRSLNLENKQTSAIPLKESVDDSPSKNKTFNISDKSSGGGVQDGGCVPLDVYAVVDISAKKRYRPESDAIKKEGSGIPQHYTVKEKPPESCEGEGKKEVTKM